MNAKGPRIWINIFVSFLVMVEPAVLHAAEASNAAPVGISKSRGDAEYQNLLKDPVIAAVEKDTQMPVELGLSADDPSLDADPFFLNGQSWSQDKSASDELTASETPTEVTLHLRSVKGQGASWSLHQSVHKILDTGDFVFFAANNNFKLFDKESAGLSSAGEGVFFVSYRELLAAAADRVRVPVYFLPLPDGGWRGKNVSALYFQEDDIVTLSNGDGLAPIPVEKSALGDIVQAQRFNLFMALLSTWSWSHEEGTLQDLSDLRAIVPVAGVTAGFGALFTGINIADPSKSVFGGKSNRFFSLLKDFFSIPRAEAATKLDPKLIKKLKRMGVVLSLAMTASVILRFTVFRDHFNEKHAAEEAAKGAPGVMGVIGRHIRDIGDVNAHTLMTFNKFASVWFANTVEFVSDRFFPQLASGHNTLIRKFLDKTVYFVRGTADKLPVSGKTWLLGSVVMGGTDTAFVTYQLYSVVPWLAHDIAHHFPTLQTRVDEAYDVGNPNISSMNRNEVLRNASGYVTSPQGFSEELQSQLYEREKALVAEQMRNEGLNPLAPENESDFHARLEKGLNARMQQAGLPSKDDFLFDANTLYANVIGLLGYRLPKTAREANLDESRFHGLRRSGLLISSTKDAITLLKNRMSMNPLGLENPHLFRALQLLENSEKDMNILLNFAKAPVETLFPSDAKVSNMLAVRFKDYLKRFRTAREQMMTLTYEGDIRDVVDYLPPQWRSADPQVLALAAGVFRAAMAKNLEGDAPIEKPYVPARKDKVTRWQESKATVKASEMYFSRFGTAFNPAVANAEEAYAYKKIYAEALSNVVGLFPDYSKDPSLEDRVLEVAGKATETRLADNSIQTYLRTISRADRIRFEAELLASNYAKSYLEVVQAAELPAIAPAQPGQLQKWRQSIDGWKTESRSGQIGKVSLTRLARAWESLTPDHRYETGRKAWLDRNVPAWYYFKQSNIRIWCGAITKVTAVYWFNYFVWGMNLPAALVALSLVASFTINTPVQIMNRLFANQGWKPMGRFFVMFGFAFIYTWATFWGSIPEQIFMGDFVRLYDILAHQHLFESLTAAGFLVGAGVLVKKARKALDEKREKDRVSRVPIEPVCEGLLVK